MKELLSFAAVTADAAAGEPAVPDALQRGWSIVSDGMAELSVELASRDDGPESYREMLYEELEERAQERGLA